MKAQENPVHKLIATLSQSIGKPDNQVLVRQPPPGAHVPASIPDPGLTTVTVLPPAPILHGRPRTGAIASLPKEKRDMTCRMIANGVPYKKIAQALDELGFVVTERNISNWVTHGGYAEWCALFQDALQNTLHQDALLQYHRSDDSPELAEVGLQSVAVRLSEILLRQAPPTQDGEVNVSKLEPVVNLLCRINKELLAAQKYRDDCKTKAFRTPARLRAQDHEKLVQAEAAYSAGAHPKFIDDAEPQTEKSTSTSTQPLPTDPATSQTPPPATVSPNLPKAA